MSWKTLPIDGERALVSPSQWLEKTLGVLTEVSNPQSIFLDNFSVKKDFQKNKGKSRC